MEIFKISQAGIVAPYLIDFLATIPEGAYSYNFHGLRHPGGIYNLISHRLIKDIGALIKTINTYESQVGDIYSNFRIVLDDLFKLYESCFEVMLCFTPNEAGRPSATAHIDQWLKRKGYLMVDSFKAQVEPEIAFLKNIHNKLKHTSNELRFLNINGINTLGFGYYLEVADSNGGVKPLDYQNFPISIAFELRRIQYIVYKMSDSLLQVISNQIRTYFPKEVYSTLITPVNEDIFLELDHMVKSFPDFFLLNEKGNEYYTTEIEIIAGVKFIKFKTTPISNIEFDKHYPSQIQINILGYGDGFTRTFAYPHLGDR